MSKVFSLIMSFIFLFVISQQAVVVMHFKLNQKAIIVQYCINKNKPELQCNGNCYLNKELQETENSDSEKIINNKNFDLTFNAESKFKIHTPNLSKNREKTNYLECRHSEPYLEILVPPPIQNSIF